MPEIRGIIFDLGRVLVGIDSSRGLLGYLGINDPQELKRLTSDPIFHDYNAGIISAQEFHREVCRCFSLEMDFAEFCHVWCDFFYPHEDMFTLISGLKEQYALGLLSDTDPLHWGHICKSYPVIPQVFKTPSLSYEIGALKPDPRNFADAVGKLDLKPEECVFIDDLPGNIEGARRAGLEGIVFTGAADLRRELAVLGVDI